MQSLSSDARFLGIDLHALWRDVRKSWRGMHQWPVLAWLTPDVPVRLLQSDGAESLWSGGVGPSQGGQRRPGRFVAVELPEQSVLRRSLHLPPMNERDTASAAALDARSASPFATHDLVWGYHAGPLQRGVRTIDIALASRKQVVQYLSTQNTRLHSALEPEVWVFTKARSPIVLAGFGEDLRNKYATHRRRLGYALLLLVSALLLGIAITPVAQLRLRAIEAVHAYEAMAHQTASMVRQREELLQAAEQLGALAELLSGRIEPLRILDKLTQLLPDDTSVQSFKIQGAKVTLVGLTGNASKLMQLLGDQPGLRDVRAPSAATRVSGGLKETFVIEFSLDPQLYGVVSAPEPVVSTVPAITPAQTPTSGVAPTGPNPQEAVRLTSPAVASPAPPSTGGATFGGGGVFGDASRRTEPKQNVAPASLGNASPASAPTLRPAP